MESTPYGDKNFWSCVSEANGRNEGELQPRCAVVYIDNITIFSPSFRQQLIDLGEVFIGLTLVNLKLNLEKCNFVKTEVKVWDTWSQNKEYVQIQKRWIVFRD